MRDESGQPFNLAIETSGHVGSVSLGCGDQLLASTSLEQHRRHNVELMPAIDALCRSHDVAPKQLGQVYVSVGPGSFSGLRVAVATAKMLAQVLGVKLVAVPTLHVVAQNAPADAKHVAVALNLKHDEVYAGLFERHGETFEPANEPSLRTMQQLVDHAPRPLTLLGDPLPPLPANVQDVTLLDPTFATARSEAVWRLGRSLAQAGRFVDALNLLPLYVRPPEAQVLWDQRLKQAASQQP